MNSCKIKITRERYAKLMEFQIRDFKAGGNKTVDEIADQFIAAEINRQENAIMESITKIELCPSTKEIMPPPIEETVDEIQEESNKEPEEKTTFKGQHELYTIEQASSYLGINRAIIEQARINCELYAAKLGYRFMYKRKDLDKWFEKYLETKRMTGKKSKTA
ncbi:MAG: helix-turn-helix domain-containing protein [Fibrobacter sp.]|nr:helix-turn-helix domain-containing protein [Fibrobacter sp.]MBR2307516.1 helix-turn-helix domain-containing protein [Fibrobacter sp.]